jgi:hypothetical protein
LLNFQHPGNWDGIAPCSCSIMGRPLSHEESRYVRNRECPKNLQEDPRRLWRASMGLKP